ETRIGKLGPTFLIVWLDRRLILGECQFGTNVCIEVAVGHMVDHLSYRPSARPIRRVELLRREPAHSFAHSRGNLLDGIYRRKALRFRHWSSVRELADGIAEVRNSNCSAHRILLNW